MPGTQVPLGPFTKGLHNSPGTGEYIADDELFDVVNLEVDVDGSLANRPAITSTVPSGLSGRFKIIGTFFPSTSGIKYLVLSYGSNFNTVGLYSLASGTIITTRAIKSNVAVQYNNNLYVVPASDGVAGTGGFWSGATTPIWGGSVNMPNGDDAVIFNDRLWISAGLFAVANNDSYVWYSCFLNPQTWIGDAIPANVTSNDAGFITTEQGNGQRTISLVVMNNDIVIFKEHSTFRFTYSTDPKKGSISKVSSTIGTPALKCAAAFDNNNVYVLHDNSVYELYNYTYTKLSAVLLMTPIQDSDIYGDSNYGLTIFRNRLFVRYYGMQYVFSLLTGRWSRWVTNKKFISLFIVPNPQGFDRAYAHSISISDTIELYSFVDSRIQDIQVKDNFNCSITTKTYDFSFSWAYKVLFWWGMTISTSGDTNVNIQLPNTGANLTWTSIGDKYTSWAAANSGGQQWSSTTLLTYPTTRTYEKGPYTKQFLKFNKKIRFRQAFFTVTTPAIANTVGDSCVRIWDMSAFVLKKQTVTAKTNS